MDAHDVSWVLWLTRLVQTTIVLAILYRLAIVVYNLVFHPLRSYPGPLLWRASRLPWNLVNLRGGLAWRIHELHQKYGPVVRIAPDELSFATSGAWKSIYRPRAPEFPKCLDGRGIAGPNPQLAKLGIIGAPQERHTRLRRAIAPAFSERALRAQEACLQRHTSRLVGKLLAAQGSQDLARWFGLTAFDIISDLAFGQEAGCLEHADQPWLAVIGNRARSIVWFQFVTYYKLEALVPFLAPRGVMEARKRHGEMTMQKVKQRLAAPADENRRDFMSYITGDEATEKLSERELGMMASAFIVAGSGTTATALSGIVFFLTRPVNKDKYQRLVHEVRAAFHTEGEITGEATSRLAYLKAVIDEGLRLYPPSPSALPRWVPGNGVLIDEKWVPGGMAVGVHQLSAGRAEWNFTDAGSFRPERWFDRELPAGAVDEFAKDDKAAIQPFSYGPRACIGKSMAYVEMRFVLAKLLLAFDLEAMDKSDTWLKGQKTFLIWEKGPLMVGLKSRK